MEKQHSRTPLRVLSRVIWFCVFPHLLVVCVLAIAGFLTYANLEQRTSRPEEGFATMLLVILVPYAAVICAIVVMAVSVASLSLSLIRWRSRTVAFFTGAVFLIVANVSGVSAVALLVYADMK